MSTETSSSVGRQVARIARLVWAERRPYLLRVDLRRHQHRHLARLSVRHPPDHRRCDSGRAARSPQPAVVDAARDPGRRIAVHVRPRLFLRPRRGPGRRAHPPADLPDTAGTGHRVLRSSRHVGDHDPPLVRRAAARGHPRGRVRREHTRVHFRGLRDRAAVLHVAVADGADAARDPADRGCHVDPRPAREIAGGRSPDGPCRCRRRRGRSAGGRSYRARVRTGAERSRALRRRARSCARGRAAQGAGASDARRSVAHRQRMRRAPGDLGRRTVDRRRPDDDRRPGVVHPVRTVCRARLPQQRALHRRGHARRRRHAVAARSARRDARHPARRRRDARRTSTARSRSSSCASGIRRAPTSRRFAASI